MKRSEINAIIRDGDAFFSKMGWRLPAWASWGVEDWKAHLGEAAEIFSTHMGWDITDFGSGDFRRRGLFLFTMRNGLPGRDDKNYAEKIMIVDVGQETPRHFHWSKMEDIINRGGGTLVVEVWRSEKDGALSGEEVGFRVDGIERRLPAGGALRLRPGESICLDRGIYHRFYGEGGRVLVGEVSMVNDDAKDNRFFEAVGRFPEIEEDEEPLRLLVSDYQRLLGV